MLDTNLHNDVVQTTTMWRLVLQIAVYVVDSLNNATSKERIEPRLFKTILKREK